ncbi:transposase [Salinibacter ruber]|uniref:transposase n=1 Tax=Salinibacter ruber TaxID=146919 RepID=UPI003C6DDC0E
METRPIEPTDILTTATFESEIDDEKIHELLHRDRVIAALLKPILNQILQAEMIEHLKAEPGEQTLVRRSYRNKSHERQLIMQVGKIELEVPQDWDGTPFDGSLPSARAIVEGTAYAAWHTRASVPVK